ncbi:hypothetical protein D3C77_335510 [compost metagenome]
MDQAELSLNEYATPEQIAQVRAMSGALHDLQMAQEGGLLGQVDPFVGQQQGFDKKLADLEILNHTYINDQKLLSDQRYLELKTQAERENAEAMFQLEKERFAQQSLGNQILMDSLDAVASSGTQALSGLISGTMSLQEGLQGVANTILNSVIGAIVEAGAKQVATMLFTSGVSQTEAAITTAAWTPAAMATSIASFGAAAVAGLAALPSLLFGGSSGKALGGPVQANGMYRVNETGAPEIFNAANGRQYMMPNQRGEVVSNKDATSGGGSQNVKVEVINNTSSQATVSETQMDDQRIIRVVVGDMQAGGKTAQTVNQITGTKRRGS